MGPKRGPIPVRRAGFGPMIRAHYGPTLNPRRALMGLMGPKGPSVGIGESRCGVMRGLRAADGG
jgi:hypothetical protein